MTMTSPRVVTDLDALQEEQRQAAERAAQAKNARATADVDLAVAQTDLAMVRGVADVGIVSNEPIPQPVVF